MKLRYMLAGSNQSPKTGVPHLVRLTGSQSIFRFTNEHTLNKRLACLFYLSSTAFAAIREDSLCPELVRITMRGGIPLKH